MQDLTAQIIIALIGTLLAAVLSMAGYWLLFGRKMLTREEAVEIARTHCPYVEDRKFIAEIIEGTRKTEPVLKELTKAITDLKIELAQLRSERHYRRDNNYEQE